MSWQCQLLEACTLVGHHKVVTYCDIVQIPKGNCIRFASFSGMVKLMSGPLKVCGASVLIGGVIELAEDGLGMKI